jgi:hypothetical protein
MMAKILERLKTVDVRFYVVVIIVASLAWASQSYMQLQAQKDLEAELSGQGGVVGAVTSDLEKKSIDALLDVNQLVTTLGTALLGGVFYLLFESRRGFAWIQRKWAVVVGVLLVSVSIYYGYVAENFVIWTLTYGNPPFMGPICTSAEHIHFYTFLLSVIFFADFIFHNLPEELSHET